MATLNSPTFMALYEPLHPARKRRITKLLGAQDVPVLSSAEVLGLYEAADTETKQRVSDKLEAMA